MRIIVPRDLAQDILGEIRIEAGPATLLSQSETTSIIVVKELPEHIRQRLQRIPGVRVIAETV